MVDLPWLKRVSPVATTFPGGQWIYYLWYWVRPGKRLACRRRR